MATIFKLVFITIIDSQITNLQKLKNIIHAKPHQGASMKFQQIISHSCQDSFTFQEVHIPYPQCQFERNLRAFEKANISQIFIGIFDNEHFNLFYFSFGEIKNQIKHNSYHAPDNTNGEGTNIYKVQHNFPILFPLMSTKFLSGLAGFYRFHKKSWDVRRNCKQIPSPYNYWETIVLNAPFSSPNEWQSLGDKTRAIRKMFTSGTVDML